MKKILLTLSLLSVVSIANAQYLMTYPLEKSAGGPLPNDSIVFIADIWEPTSPLYTDWVAGPSYDCSVYPPNTSYFDIDSYFIRSQHQYNSCKYTDVRDRQEREYNNARKEYRNVGEPIEETGTDVYTRNDPPEPIQAYFCGYDTPSATQGGYFITVNSTGDKVATWAGNTYALGTNYTFLWNYEGEDRQVNSQFYQAKFKTSSGGLDYYTVCIFKPE